MISIQLSAGVIVESEPACRVFDTVPKSENESIVALTKEIRSLKRKIGSKGKSHTGKNR